MITLIAHTVIEHIIILIIITYNNTTITRNYGSELHVLVALVVLAYDHHSPGILGFEMEKNNIKLKISGSVHYVLLYYL